ncbi:MAG: carboxypeptidase regulatory-like domain-containing protein [Candidatus Micrarchaeia archaeon]
MDTKMAILAGMLLLFASVSAFVVTIPGDTVAVPLKADPALQVTPPVVPRACDVTVSYAPGIQVKVYMANGVDTGLGCKTDSKGKCVFKFGAAQPRGVYTVKAGTAQAKVTLEPSEYCASNIKSFTLSPQQATVQAGRSTSFRLIALDAAGSPADIKASFSLSDPSFGTLTTPGWLGANEVMFSGTKAGKVTLTAVYLDRDATAQITVEPGMCTQSAIIGSVQQAYAAGSNATFSVNVTDEFGNPKAAGVSVEYASPEGKTTEYTFTSGSDGIARVSFPTGLKSGPASIKVYANNLKFCPADSVDERHFTVVAGMPAQVIITPQETVEDVGDSVALVARVYDANMNELPGQKIIWSSRNTTVATVDSNGVVKANFPGEAEIVASALYTIYSTKFDCSIGFCIPVIDPVIYTVNGSAIVRVRTGEAANIVLEPVSVELQPEQMLKFNAAVYDKYGVQIQNPALVWSAERGTITQDGIYFAPVLAGPDTVTVSYNGISESAQVTVVPGQPMSIDAYSENMMPVETTQSVYAKVTDKNGNAVPNVNVVFNYLAGDAYVTALNPVAVTNESGIATVTINIGDKEGAVMYSMTVEGTTITDIDSFMVYVPNATVFGTVTDTQMNPVAGAQVVIEGTGYSAIADENGNYLISEVDLDGPYTITALASGYRPTGYEVVIHKNHDYNVNFVLVPYSVVEGHVHDSSGSPVEHALVVLSLGGTEQAAATTNAEGHYQITVPVPAEAMYTLSVSADNYDPTVVSFPLMPKSTQVIDVVLTGYDDEPPVITVISPSATEGPYFSGMVVVEAVVYDAHYAGARTYINGGEEVEHANAHFTRAVNTANYPDGQLQVLITATDTHGYTAERTVDMLVDNVPPEAAFVDPTPAEMSEHSEPFSVRVQASDATGISSIAVRVNGNTVTTCNAVVCDATVDVAGLSGTFTVEAVVNGQLTQTVISRQFVAVQQPSAPAQVLVSAVPSTIFAGGQSTVRATVLNQNMQPLENVQVTFTSNCGTLSTGTAATNASGVATTQFTSATEGQCTVNASVGAITNTTVITVLAIEQAGTLEGTVTNASGAALGGAVVQVLKQGAVLFETVAGPDGAYSLALPADTYDVHVSYPSYLTSRDYGVQVEAGQTVSKNYVLTKMARIYGTVTNQTGSAVAGATVKAYRNGVLVSTTSTSATGAYEFVVPAGVYVIEVTHPDYMRAMHTLYVPTAGEAQKDFVLYR